MGLEVVHEAEELLPERGQLESQCSAHRQVVLGVAPDRVHRVLPGQGRASRRSVSWSTFA